MERLLTIKDISGLLQVSQALVYKWVHFGFIPYIKIGSLIRFKESEISKWIKKRQKSGRESLRLNLEELVLL